MEAVRITPAQHLAFSDVPPDRDESWQEVAAANRERIRILEHELDRTRTNVHNIAGEVAAVNFLAREVGRLASDIHELAQRVEIVSRRALEKPTATGLGVFAQYLGVIVALVALVVAATR